jgi:hypothetical protein
MLNNAPPVRIAGLGYFQVMANLGGQQVVNLGLPGIGVSIVLLASVALRQLFDDDGKLAEPPLPGKMLPSLLICGNEKPTTNWKANPSRPPVDGECRVACSHHKWSV